MADPSYECFLPIRHTGSTRGLFSMMYVEVVGGFILLLGGAEVMVRGAVGLAERFGISKMVIGMTVVAFGTSAPELLVSLNAALSGASGIAIGNVVGSNIANVLLILGAAGLIMPIACAPGTLVRDGIILLIGSAVFTVLVFRDQIDLIGGLILLAVFVAFLGYSYWREMHGDQAGADLHAAEVDEIDGVPHSLWLASGLLIAGFAGLIIGAELLVEGGVQIARTFGVSEAVIGLTIIAFGTSLPELAASVVAAYRKHADIALGNVVGSNLFNLLLVIGVTATVTPVDVPARVPQFDIWIMIAATLFLMPFMIAGRKQIGRVEAFIFLLAYGAYITALALGVDRFF